MRQYKQKARFTAIARCAVDPDKGKFLAKASLADLKSILPTDAEDYPDLLAIAGNATVINLGNGNGDMMDTDVGAVIFPQFKHKFINLEHDRSLIVGHLTTAGLTKYNANYAIGSGSEILEPDEVKDSYEPFNIAVGGYIYRAIFEEVCEKIIEANDPNSPNYLDVAFSWELAFDEHKLFVGSNERGGKGEVISDPAKIQAWSSFLKSRKGTGLLPDGRPVYRLVSWAKQENGQIDPDSVLALGVGLTLAPAGKVAGIVTPDTPEKQETSASVAEISLNQENSGEKISQSKTTNVTKDTTITMKVFKSLDDVASLNDETAKEFSFANIQNIVQANKDSVQQQIQDAMKEAAKQHKAEVDQKEQAVAAATQKAETALADLAGVKAELQAAQAAVADLQNAQQAAIASQKFNERMAHFDEKFQLEDAHRKAIAKRIQGLDDTAFASVADELNAFLAPFDKEKAVKKEDEKQQAVASQQTTEADPKKVAEAALANTQAASASVPNTVVPTQSLKDKYANAFKVGGGLTIVTKNK